MDEFMKGFITLHLFVFCLQTWFSPYKYKFENKKSLKDKYFKNLILCLSGETYLFNSNIPHSPK